MVKAANIQLAYIQKNLLSVCEIIKIPNYPNKENSFLPLFFSIFWTFLLFAPMEYSFFQGSFLPKTNNSCDKLGWFPTEFGLKDHTVFWFDGFYYVSSIYLPGETQFAYGRSQDLCTWEELTPILDIRTTGTWDEFRIWAPHVIIKDDTYYLYYTGVTNDFTQSIMLATSTNPADSLSWQIHGMIFQPDHDQMIWQVETWADCRDPMVILIDQTYWLFYTGRDVTGGIIGAATSSTPIGPWTDQGALINAMPNGMYESPTVVFYESNYYIFYLNTLKGESYRYSSTLQGEWSEEKRIFPGWAHEVWLDQKGDWMTSYLTNYTISISHLTWDHYFAPPHPFIGKEIHHQLFPAIINTN